MVVKVCTSLLMIDVRYSECRFHSTYVVHTLYKCKLHYIHMEIQNIMVLIGHFNTKDFSAMLKRIFIQII